MNSEEQQEAHRVWQRIQNGACPMAGCRGDWRHEVPYYVVCTIEPIHRFAKSDLMAGKATLSSPL